MLDLTHFNKTENDAYVFTLNTKSESMIYTNSIMLLIVIAHLKNSMQQKILRIKSSSCSV